MMGVKFNDFHSWDDFCLVLGSKEIEAPSVKSETISVPGADGVLDFTDYFGESQYNQRKIKLDFTSILPFSEQLKSYSYILSCLQGRRMKIVLDADPEFYYMGRIEVESLKQSRNLMSLSVNASCDPYKLKCYKTIVTSSVSETGVLIFDNLRKRVIPRITVSAPVTIVFNGNSYSLNAGSHVVSGIQFVQGKNILNVTGTANVTTEYQEGAL